MEQIKLPEDEKADLMNEVAHAVHQNLTLFMDTKMWPKTTAEHVMVDIDWLILGGFAGLMHIVVANGGGKIGLERMANLFEVAEENFGPELLEHYGHEAGHA